jgi:hypothetical protein
MEYKEPSMVLGQPGQFGYTCMYVLWTEGAKRATTVSAACCLLKSCRAIFSS